MEAARNEAPKDSLYDPIARGLNTTCRKSLQCIEVVTSTSAASGIRTIALRKNVVKPKVSPNPGSTLGCRKLTMSRLQARDARSAGAHAPQP